MSLRCSLFGHHYGGTEVEQEREQAGNELVVTSREIKICQRCGERLIISENKEVTTVEAADDVGGASSASTGGGAMSGSSGRDDASGTGGGGEGVDEGGAPESGRQGGTGGSTSDAGESAGDTGGSAGDRRRDPPVTDPEMGSDDRPSSGTGETAGPSAGAGKADIPPTQKNDAVILDDEGEEVEPEEWSDGESTGVDDDWEPETDTEDEPEESPSASSGLTVPDGEFRCTECGFTTSVEGSSLRAGDFCPECHRGSLEHVPE